RSSSTASSRRSCRSRSTSRESSRLSRSKAWVLTGLLLAATPGAVDAQVFLATRSHPDFAIGPLFVRATVTPALGTTAVDVLWSLVIPPTKSGADIEQDLFLLWPDEVDELTVRGTPDPELARYVEARGYSVIGDGRLPLHAQSLYRMGREAAPQPIPGGAPFVSFVRQGGPLGLTSPATYVRIPWTPLLANRTWLMRLGMGLPRLVRPRPATWVENVFWGPRYTISLTFNDVRGRALFAALFFVLGNLAGPLLTMLVKRVGGKLSGRIHISPRSVPVERQTGTVVSRETLARIAPGSTTYEEVIRLCGADHEEHEQPLAPDRRLLVYRGRKVVTQRRRRFGWLSTVSRWDVEHHEVEITLERNVVQDVQARVRRTHLAQPGAA